MLWVPRLRPERGILPRAHGNELENTEPRVRKCEKVRRRNHLPMPARNFFQVVFRSRSGAGSSPCSFGMLVIVPRHLMAQIGERSLESRVAQPWFSVAMRITKRWILF